MADTLTRLEATITSRKGADPASSYVASLFAKGSESKYLAGGHTLIPVMKQRLASPSDVIDLARIKELVGVEPTGDGITDQLRGDRITDLRHGRFFA